MTAISGATSYDIMRSDLQAASTTRKVKAIILNIDSPGGEVNGASELASDSRRRAGESRSSPMSAAWSVGGLLGRFCGATVSSRRRRQYSARSACRWHLRESAPKGEKSYRFVSSQSPDKNPDIGTEAAASKFKQRSTRWPRSSWAMSHAIAAWISKLSLTGFGKGGTFVGQSAVEAGLANSIGTFEAVLAELSVELAPAAATARTDRRRPNGREGQGRHDERPRIGCMTAIRAPAR
jgi:hypothetical protein